ncbi:hypothetical protein [Cytobacillus purgationiresistens]|uniref:DUF4944 domain-containing protein n=1 Tax=Cytobacillus purgationiresistens TaxID=863449 RepID=A0ABU0AM51_9BACI|nr:hypothetical protein [Cytobacillus purgationiresistens]MDQ0272335.1 hypothetical protein [Cytobacillus purgationiresistens]
MKKITVGMIIVAFLSVISYFFIDFLDQEWISENKEYEGKSDEWEVSLKLTSKGEGKYNRLIQMKYLGTDDNIQIDSWHLEGYGFDVGGADIELIENSFTLRDEVETDFKQYDQQKFSIKWGDNYEEEFLLLMKDDNEK